VLGALRIPQWIVTGDLTQGDSGAPVAFHAPGSEVVCIAGIVTSIERYYQPVYAPNEAGGYNETGLYVAERGGFGFQGADRASIRTSYEPRDGAVVIRGARLDDRRPRAKD
jgi:hypothetical protein